MCPRISWELVADPWNHWVNVLICCPILVHRKLTNCVPHNTTPEQPRYAGYKATTMTHSRACLVSPSKNIATYMRHYFFPPIYQTCYSFLFLHFTSPPPPPQLLFHHHYYRYHHLHFVCWSTSTTTTLETCGVLPPLPYGVLCKHALDVSHLTGRKRLMAESFPVEW